MRHDPERRLHVWLIPTIDILIIEIIIRLILFYCNRSQRVGEYGGMVQLVAFIATILRLSEILKFTTVTFQSIRELHAIIQVNHLVPKAGAPRIASTPSTMVCSRVEDCLEVLIIRKKLVLLKPVLFAI